VTPIDCYERLLFVNCFNYNFALCWSLFHQTSMMMMRYSTSNNAWRK